MNNPIGTSDSNGALLIPSMRAHETNSIKVDPATFPLQADMQETPDCRARLARRHDRALQGQRRDASAMVSFKDGKGEWLPTGSEAWVNGKNFFVIGYTAKPI